MAMMPGVTFRTIDEPQPGAKLAAVYAQRAQAYAAWYLQHGDAARPSAAEGLEALRLHMPELVPVYDAMRARGGSRRPRGRPHVHDVEAARRRDRLLAGRAARRRARSRGSRATTTTRPSSWMPSSCAPPTSSAP